MAALSPECDVKIKMVFTISALVLNTLTLKLSAFFTSIITMNSTAKLFLPQSDTLQKCSFWDNTTTLTVSPSKALAFTLRI